MVISGHLLSASLINCYLQGNLESFYWEKYHLFLPLFHWPITYSPCLHANNFRVKSDPLSVLYNGIVLLYD